LRQRDRRRWRWIRGNELDFFRVCPAWRLQLTSIPPWPRFRKILLAGSGLILYSRSAYRNNADCGEIENCERHQRFVASLFALFENLNRVGNGVKKWDKKHIF